MLVGSHLDDELGELGGVGRGIDLVGVDDEERGVGEIEEMAVVGLGHGLEVVELHGGFEVPTPLADTFHQRLVAGLEEDDDAGLGDAGAEVGGDTVVEAQLLVAEGDAGEDAVFLEEVVAHGGLVEEVALEELLLLLVAGGEEEELGLEGVAFGVLVVVLEEGVGLGLLEDHACVECGAEGLGEGGLADADGAFDGDVGELVRH